MFSFHTVGYELVSTIHSCQMLYCVYVADGKEHLATLAKSPKLN